MWKIILVNSNNINGLHKKQMGQMWEGVGQCM